MVKTGIIRGEDIISALEAEKREKMKQNTNQTMPTLLNQLPISAINATEAVMPELG